MLWPVSGSALLGGDALTKPLVATVGSGVFPGLPAELGPHFRNGNRGIFRILESAVDQLTYFRMEGEPPILFVPPPPHALGCDDRDRKAGD